MTADRPLAVLAARDLRVELRTEAGIVHAVNGVDFDLMPGEVLGIVGESGCGKSMTALSLMRLVPEPGRVAGRIDFQGRNLLDLTLDEMRAIRGNEIGMVFQDPLSSLNPVLTVGRQVSESLQEHRGMSRGVARRRTIELLDRVGIPEPHRRVDDHPFQFSGGMRQRVMVAIAIACEPQVLIADEPTTALDVTIQAQILDLLRGLRKDLNTAIVLISHDLGVIAGIADRVVVMYAVFIVEMAPVDDLFASPTHPYTRGLIQAVSRFDRPRGGRLLTIEGQPPDLIDLPTGCPFWHRCTVRLDPRCETEAPTLRELTAGHWVASHYAEAS